MYKLKSQEFKMGRCFRQFTQIGASCRGDDRTFFKSILPLHLKNYNDNYKQKGNIVSNIFFSHVEPLPNVVDHFKPKILSDSAVM